MFRSAYTPRSCLFIVFALGQNIHQFCFLVPRFFFRTGANRFKDVWETGVFPFNQTMRLKIVHVNYHDLQVVLREIEPVQNVRLINQKYLQQEIKCFTTIGCLHSETLQTDERHAA